MKKFLKLTALFLGTSVASSPVLAPVSAGSFPEKSITMVVPFAAGGGTDNVARLAAPGLEEELGQSIIIQNIAGAGGTVGASALASSDSDGYTLGFMPIGTMTTQPHLRKVAYNADSWEPVCRLVDDPMSVLVAPDSGMTSLDDVIAASSGGKQLRSAGPPPGSLPHIAQAALANAYGLDFKYVPHEGGGATARSLLGGQVDIFVDLAGNAKKFGLVNLALLGSDRHPVFPDLPTTGELGGHALNYSIWFGIFAPAGTPDAVMTRLADACAKLAASPKYRKKMANANRWVAYLGRDDFTKFFREQYQNNGSLLNAIGLKK